MHPSEVILCCGLGGVGKTTTAAAMAIGQALAGRRVCVLTIDPARRLADALGVRIGAEPQPVTELELGTGTLHALMLDQKKTFDHVIRRFSPTQEIADRLVDNRYYQAVSERLGGAHEYMAMEKLYELVHNPRWDVIVVDTPPSQHALDFFEAPRRVRDVFDHRVLRALLQPSRGLVAVTTHKVARAVTRLAGERVLGDIGEFFQLMSEFSTGFRERSDSVAELLSSEHARYYLITEANNPARNDTLDFLDALRGRELHFAGVLVNRVTSPPPDPLPELPSTPPDGVTPNTWNHVVDALHTIADQIGARSRAQRHAIDELHDHAPELPMWELSDRPDGVTNLRHLAELADHLPPHPPATPPT